jgi:hypothetical protein
LFSIAIIQNWKYNVNASWHYSGTFSMKMAIQKYLKADYFILPPVLALAYYLSFIPHHNYSYVVHLDEWVHMACANEIISSAGVTGLVDPFTGGTAIMNQSYEIGFHVFWAVVHQVSGLDWMTIYKYFPGIIFILTVLAVYILARRQGFGWEAALFTTLIPTTVGILGPGFLVPVALGLFFMPLCFFIALNLKSWWSYPAFLVVMVFLVSLHGATAVGVVLMLLPFVLMNLVDDLKHGLSVLIVLLFPFLALFLLMPHLIVPHSQTLMVTQPDVRAGVVEVPVIVQTYGYLPLTCCLLGIAAIGIKGGKNDVSLVFGLLVLLAMLVVYFTFHYGIGIMYFRGLLFMMLMTGIIAGKGLMELRNLKLPEAISERLKLPGFARNVGYALAAALVCVTLVICIPVRQHTPYYHMIDSQDYEAFVWIRDNLDSRYDKAILDPWKGVAFTAITGKRVYTWIGAAPLAGDIEVYQFLAAGCENTAFIKEKGATFVYTLGEVRNPDLVMVREHVYLLKEPS